MADRLRPKPAQPKRSGAVRRFVVPLLVLAALGYGGKTAYEYFVEGRFLVSTDDAYVGASTSIIAAKATGHLTAVPVVDNQVVHQGDLLASIDDGDYQNAVDSAKARIATQDATIARFGRQIDAQGAIIAQAEAQVQASQAQLLGTQADVERASLEYDRSLKLAQTNFGSQQRLEQATADRDRTAAALAAARATAASTVAAVEGAKANLDVLKAQRDEASRQRGELETALAKAERDLSFTRVVAPFDGVVGNKAAEVGNFVQPGTRLMALVPLNASYVDANFKETQLADIKAGQKVDVSIDALGGQTIEGTVASISPASGSQFSLLPPDNATGNFTKVVQRVAVRVTFPEEVLKEVPLRPGLSVVATIHTRDPDAAEAEPSRRARVRSLRRQGRQAVSDAVALRPPVGRPIAPARPIGPQGQVVPHFSLRRLAAFIFMVFGMFMAILDIQIVSASLSQIQAGLSASSDEVTWVQTSYLIAEVIMIPLSGFLSRVVSTRVIFTISAGGFTAMSFMCAQATGDRRDDPLAGAAGLHRRRHDPDRVRLGLHHLPALEAAVHRADHRARGDARPDHRPDGRRLPDRLVLLALAVPGQPRSGNHRHRRGLAADRLRRARLVAPDPFRLSRPAHHGGLSRGDRICARGGAVEGLVRERAGDDRHRRLGGQRRPLLLARVHRAASRSSTSPPFATAISGPARRSASCSASGSTA